MTGQDGLLDEVAWIVHDNVCGCRGGRRCDTPDEDHYAAADAVLPVVQRHIDAAREQVAEQIAQAIEARRSTSPYAGFEALTIAANIARQHAKGDGDA